jgi:hypothetical protein
MKPTAPLRGDSSDLATDARYLSFTVPDIEHWPEVQDASGAGALTNELMTIYAAQCHLNIGKRCGVQVLLLASRPFCDTLFETTEFRRGIDEATNRTHEMLQNLQDSLGSIKIKIKL